MHWHIFSLYHMSFLPNRAALSLSISISLNGHLEGHALSPFSLRIGIRRATNFSSSDDCITLSIMQRSPKLLPIKKIRVFLPRKYTSLKNQSQSFSVTASLEASSLSCRVIDYH